MVSQESRVSRVLTQFFRNVPVSAPEGLLVICCDYSIQTRSTPWQHSCCWCPGSFSHQEINMVSGINNDTSPWTQGLVGLEHLKLYCPQMKARGHHCICLDNGLVPSDIMSFIKPMSTKIYDAITRPKMELNTRLWLINISEWCKMKKTVFSLLLYGIWKVTTEVITLILYSSCI